jgi:hypothetical protein
MRIENHSYVQPFWVVVDVRRISPPSSTCAWYYTSQFGVIVDDRVFYKYPNESMKENEELNFS